MLFSLTRLIRDRRIRRIAADHLARMGDHALSDIGLVRDDVDLVSSRGRLEV